MSNGNKSGSFTSDQRAPVTDRREHLVNNEYMSDVIFLVGDDGKQRMYGHKLILITASDYFQTMFESNFRESNAKEIALPDIEPSVFKELLRYMYCGKIDVTMENFRDLYLHAEKFMLWEVPSKISDFVKTNVTPENALKMLLQIRSFKMSSVEERCVDLISKNPLFYLRNVGLLTNLDRETFCLILKSKKFNCSDRQLLQVIDAWQKDHPTVATDDLKLIIDATSRVPDCHELRLFGYRDSAPSSSNSLEFENTSLKPVSLYGVGAFVTSKCKVEIKILKSTGSNNRVFDTIILTEEYEISEDNVTGITNCFFKKITLEPDTNYLITCVSKQEPISRNLSACRIEHSYIKMTIKGNNQGGSRVAHLFVE